MHIGRGARDFAERGRLEVALTRSNIDEPPVPPRDACVVQTLIAEVGSHMTSDAVAFAAKYLQSGLLLVRQSGPVAVDIAVVR